jgi:hypothetical protein
MLLELVSVTESTDIVEEADFTSADEVIVVLKVGAGDASDVVTEAEDVRMVDVSVPFDGCVVGIVDCVVGFERT